MKLAYVGSRNKLDAELVRPYDIPFYGIFAGKLRRYFSWRNFTDPFLVLLGFFQSLAIMAIFRPDVVFSKGGFVSLPVVFAAFITRRPIILHESDSRMGLANRIASKLAKKVCVAFPELIQKKDHGSDHAPKLAPGAGEWSKVVLTGNPVRLNVLNGDSETGYRLTGLKPGKPIVLVWGGSQGAQQINEMVQKNFQKLKTHFQIIHITGAGKNIDIKDEDYCQFDYLDDGLKHIYAITDYVVGRAGANSIYEVALIRKPNILVPLNNPDQLKNAAYFESAGASLILGEGHDLADLLIALRNNPEQQKSMKEALASVSKPGAADEIADIILQF